jgi:hypothetical protein
MFSKNILEKFLDTFFNKPVKFIMSVLSNRLAIMLPGKGAFVET